MTVIAVGPVSHVPSWGWVGMNIVSELSKYLGGDDIDEILKEHVMDITSEVKKDEHEQKRKRGSDYER